MKKAFVSGAFDLFHEGHLHILQEAAKLGELHVAVNSDQYCRSKGINRPANDLNTRIRSVLDTGLVHTVYGIHDTPYQTIMNLRPDYIVVGSDYDISRVVCAEECIAWGGRIVIIQRIKGLSTTKILLDREG